MKKYVTPLFESAVIEAEDIVLASTGLDVGENGAEGEEDNF